MMVISRHCVSVIAEYKRCRACRHGARNAVGPFDPPKGEASPWPEARDRPRNTKSGDLPNSQFLGYRKRTIDTTIRRSANAKTRMALTA